MRIVKKKVDEVSWPRNIVYGNNLSIMLSNFR